MSAAHDAELCAAIARGDLAEVERLLSEGASPLASVEGGESVLRLAHRHLETNPAGREVFVRVRRAARDAIQTSPGRRTGLAAAPGVSSSSDRGLSAIRRAVGETRALDVLCLECDVKNAAGALAKLVHAPRREADVAARPVEDARRLAFVLRLRGSAWTIIPFVFHPSSAWNLAAVPELAARGDGIAPVARALADAAGCAVMHARYGELTVYAPHGGIERPCEVEAWWAPEGALPTMEEAEALLPGYAGAEDLREAAAREREKLRRIDALLSERGIVVPAMDVVTDGLGVQLELRGIEPAAVERVDVVVLQELGDPAVDRTLGAAPAAPPRLGPDGRPPLAHAAPPIVAAPEPPQSASSPMGREPPPIVALDPAASTGEPPLVTTGSTAGPPRANEPPPLVTGAAEPAPVSEPPTAEPGEPPRVDGLPLATGSSGPVSEPPPVNAPPAANEPPPVGVTTSEEEPPPVATELPREPPVVPGDPKPAPPPVREPPPVVKEPAMANELPPAKAPATVNDAPPLVTEAAATDRGSEPAPPAEPPRVEPPAVSDEDSS